LSISSPLLLTDFQNSLTGTLCRKFAILLLLYIPPHSKYVSTLVKYKCKQKLIYNNKNLGK